jgi:hypothetical protein
MAPFFERSMASWGDINAVLNRLVREGTITAFWTNLGGTKPPLVLHVIVSPFGPADDRSAKALRLQIQDALAPWAPDASVTVDRSAPAGNLRRQEES